MSSELEKIEKVEEMLETQSLDKIFEIVSLVLSIEDEEDRNLALLHTIDWLVKNSIWQKAYGLAQIISESYEKSEAFQIVANHLAAIGYLEKAFSVFEEAEKASLSEKLDKWQQAELLHKTASSLFQIGATQKAYEIWERAIAVAQDGENSSDPQSSIDCSSVLREIAEYLAGKGKTEKALNIAQKIKNVGKRESALQKIAVYSQETKQVA